MVVAAIPANLVAFAASSSAETLVRTVQAAFQTSCGEGFPAGALIAFLVTVAGLPILNIGSPFWGLIFGVTASLLVERQSFSKR